MTTLAKAFAPFAGGSKSLVGSLISLGVQEIVGAVTQFASAWAEKRSRARAYSELMQLDGRMLADIGLDRGDVYAVVYGEGLKDTARDAHDKTLNALLSAK